MFTEGKWHTDDSYSYILNDDESIIVAKMAGENIFFNDSVGWLKLSDERAYEMRKANARLIAEAPEMYKLLRNAIKSEKKITELLARIDGDGDNDD